MLIKAGATVNFKACSANVPKTKASKFILQSFVKNIGFMEHLGLGFSNLLEH